MKVTLEKNYNQLIVGTCLNVKQTENACSKTENKKDVYREGVKLDITGSLVPEDKILVKETNAVNYVSSEVENFSIASETSISTLDLTSSQVQDYQTRLRALGFYSGSQDGVATSSAMKKAIKNFQKVYGLSESGTLNAEDKKGYTNVYDTNYTYKTAWNNLKATSTCASATQVFKNQIEQCSDSTLATRTNYASKILKAMIA